ncbi:long-chain-fatty-acid--CoA ligase [Salipaludibacillus sp. CUR1]|uniref:long-chain-fatty-acid--CoA ligase n=1 Tax=Salipaludibacillus sp. CUR1 TaxID=2820003 RepID=UPI001E5595BB|nr:long-chain-fatty-acid--CoA ligase [Salipaludibacillus sp. CUR1]MCE7790839.1 long-chain-fatty-acid--CoA ligase [Salipaludibacillus sp. CUR1]
MHVPLVVTDFLDRAVQLYGEKTAVIDGDRRLTYKEMNGRVQQLSRGLKSLGIQKDDKVAYLAPNTLEMLEGFYGVFQTGGVMTPLNTRLKPADYIFILNHSESQVLFVDLSLYDQLKQIKDHLETVHTIIVHGMADDANGDFAYEKWLGQFDDGPFDREPLEETDIASLLYTSGTTGDPKGVMLNHRSNYLHALSTMHHLGVSDRDTLLHVLPMFHVNGWGSPFYYTANGATQVMQREMDPALILENIKKEKVTVAHMAPTVLNMIMEQNAHNKEPLKLEQDMRVVIAGSAPPVAFVKRTEEELGWKFIQVYGMTEISPLITTSQIRSEHLDKSTDEKYTLKAKVGYSMIGSSVRVVNELDEDVPWDGKTIGEIITRSNNVMEGYWKNPDATNKTIKNGFLYTGDMASVDAEGYINIVDRKKDVIISGGENISSLEVESCLYDHPAVLEVAVVSVPHEKWGEVPHAHVVLREKGGATEEELIAFAQEKMARFKAPKGITFLEELPKTASGKIQKVQLRQPFWQDRTRTVN